MSRKLDMAIAKALGYETTWRRKVSTGGKKKKPGYVYYVCSPDDKFAQPFYDETNSIIPKYSSDGDDMLKLDAEMRKQGYDLNLNRHVMRPPWDYEKRMYYATYFNKEFPKTGKPTKYAETEPLARALAAYYALTGKEWGSKEADTDV